MARRMSHRSPLPHTPRAEPQSRYACPHIHRAADAHNTVEARLPASLSPEQARKGLRRRTNGR
eukprot:scaffold25531_cov34-Tisochrysis_lutea.AAC.3